MVEGSKQNNRELASEHPFESSYASRFGRKSTVTGTGYRSKETCIRRVHPTSDELEWYRECPFVSNKMEGHFNISGGLSHELSQVSEDPGDRND